jgi:enoyl-CoA hydratase
MRILPLCEDGRRSVASRAMSDEILLERADGVATITLNAPDRRNALTRAMARALVETCDEVDADQSIGAVVVRGEGGFFCAGGDRKTLADAGRDPATPEAWSGIGDVYRSFQRVGELEPPTVAAVRGGAVGAGMNLAFATDLRVVADDAKLISGFLPIGLHPGGGHSALLGRTGAREATAALALFGERIDGARAAELGLAWEAVADDQVDARASEIAAVPGADPELARRTARSLRSVLGPPALPWAAALDLERASQMWSMRRKDIAAE